MVSCNFPAHNLWSWTFAKCFSGDCFFLQFPPCQFVSSWDFVVSQLLCNYYWQGRLLRLLRLSGLSQSGSKLLKTVKNKFTWSDFTNFPSKFQHFHINSITVSGHFSHLIFIICQTFVGISMNDQFHDFFSLIFGGFLQFCTTVCWRFSHCDQIFRGETLIRHDRRQDSTFRSLSSYHIIFRLLNPKRFPTRKFPRTYVLCFGIWIPISYFPRNALCFFVKDPK